MKKKLLGLALLLLIPFVASGCDANDISSFSGPIKNATPINHERKSGEIADFHLTGPNNGFITEGGLTFTWEKADNADSYQIELSSTLSFVTDDEEEVYVKENNLSINQYVLNFNLPKNVSSLKQANKVLDGYFEKVRSISVDSAINILLSKDNNILHDISKKQIPINGHARLFNISGDIRLSAAEIQYLVYRAKDKFSPYEQ